MVIRAFSDVVTSIAMAQIAAVVPLPLQSPCASGNVLPSQVISTDICFTQKAGKALVAKYVPTLCAYVAACVAQGKQATEDDTTVRPTPGGPVRQQETCTTTPSAFGAHYILTRPRVTMGLRRRMYETLIPLGLRIILSFTGSSP